MFTSTAVTVQYNTLKQDVHWILNGFVMAPSTMASAGTPTTTMMPRPTVLLMEESWPLSLQREDFMQLQQQSVSIQHNTLILQVCLATHGSLFKALLEDVLSLVKTEKILSKCFCSKGPQSHAANFCWKQMSK